MDRGELFSAVTYTHVTLSGAKSSDTMGCLCLEIEIQSGLLNDVDQALI